MSDEAKRLVDAYTWAIGTRAVGAARIKLDAHLAKMQAVVDVAGDHQCTSSCKDVDGPCAIMEALRALQGGGE